ncbi:MAG TPA: UDP-N-acetylmuramoyl-tripeptide--D-alanyl-D-alanine ligase [Patescibacteria group bacterium]|nr:UDP-N-acetylmuramoyl-tripeptide--D-alanyl-D-alanine ligase [Patescibacteria group bacterium]
MKSILLKILRFLSKRIIRKYNPDVVGITGSIGKTSTKEAAAVVLGSRFRVRKSPKNYNNEIGVPLAIIGFEKTPGKSLAGWLVVLWRGLSLLLKKDKDYPEVLVLEMGADKPGDIKYLVGIAPCKIGVLTYIAHAHTEFFKTIKKIAEEKRVILTHLGSDGTAIVNFDNPESMQSAKGIKAEVVTFGFQTGADLQATDVNIIRGENGWPTGLNFKVLYKGSIVPVFLPGIVAEHLVSSALAAMAVGITMGINLVEAAESIRSLEPLAGHMRLMAGIKHTLLIDDTYNSSPEPTKSALKTLSQVDIPPGAERYAVLADMLELGPETMNAHREVGFRVGELGVDYLITVGEASKETARAAKEAGLNNHDVASFNDAESAGKFLQEKMKEGDVVLIKGSQGMRMEKVVKEVMAEPERAKDLLVRQSGEWEVK